MLILSAAKETSSDAGCVRACVTGRVSERTTSSPVQQNTRGHRLGQLQPFSSGGLASLNILYWSRHAIQADIGRDLFSDHQCMTEHSSNVRQNWWQMYVWSRAEQHDSDVNLHSREEKAHESWQENSIQHAIDQNVFDGTDHHRWVRPLNHHPSPEGHGD